MQSLGLFCCAPRPLIIGVQRGRGPPCPAALLRFQFYSIPCPSIFQVAFAIFGTVSSRSPAVSSNSTPALAEPASPLLGLAWGLDFKAPGADVRAGACALISIQEKIRRRRKGRPKGIRRREPPRRAGFAGPSIWITEGWSRPSGGGTQPAFWPAAQVRRKFGAAKGGRESRRANSPRSRWRLRRPTDAAYPLRVLRPSIEITEG